MFLNLTLRFSVRSAGVARRAHCAHSTTVIERESMLYGVFGESARTGRVSCVLTVGVLTHS